VPTPKQHDRGIIFDSEAPVLNSLNDCRIRCCLIGTSSHSDFFHLTFLTSWLTHRFFKHPANTCKQNKIRTKNHKRATHFGRKTCDRRRHIID